MNENDIYPEDPTLEIDDVEGHGLKEVAAGLGAAAVLAGGAAGATQLASSSLSVHPSSTTGPSISVQVGDPVGTADKAVDSSITGVQQTRDAALAKADAKVVRAQQVVDRAPGNVAGIVSDVRSDLSSTTAWAGDVKDAAKGAVKGEVHGASTMATSTTTTAGSTVDSTTTTVDSKVDHTTTTAATTVRAADRKVATILSVTTTTALDGVHTAKVVLHAADDGVSASAGSGWVLVKAGDQILAQVHMTDGTATASWTMPLVGGHSVSISYTGDNVFAPSLRTITL